MKLLLSLCCVVWCLCLAAEDMHDPDAEPTQQKQGTVQSAEEKQLILKTLHDEMQELKARLDNETLSLDELLKRLKSIEGQEQYALKEIAWGKYRDHLSTLLSLTSNILQQADLNVDVAEPQEKLRRALVKHGKRLRNHIEDMREDIGRLLEIREGIEDKKYLKLEKRITLEQSRVYNAYRSWVELVDAESQLGEDTEKKEQLIVEEVLLAADRVSILLQSAKKYEKENNILLAANASDTHLQVMRDVYRERFTREKKNLAEIIALLQVLERDTSVYQQNLVTATGEISEHLFSWDVISGLLSNSWNGFVLMLKNQGPGWLAKLIVFLFILLCFKIVAIISRGIVKRFVSSAKFEFSQLLQQMLVGMCARFVMIIGLIVALAQIGLPIAHLLAGLGIAGFIIDFALQDSLANFAAGGMILFCKPYDVGDFVEVGGIIGLVNKMNFVSTTVLTTDNQTNIIPNAKIWGGVIRNITAQVNRRVDLVFNIPITADAEKIEQYIQAVVADNELTIDEPAPIIRVQGMNEYALQLIVWSWCKTENYLLCKSQLCKQIPARLAKEKVQLAYPQHILQLP